MGCNSSTPVTSSLSLKQTFTSQQVTEILQKSLPKLNALHVCDTDYYTYGTESLKTFLSSDNTNDIKYVPEGFDCDDFAKVLLGREKLWAYPLSQTVQRASTFGMVTGDIRKMETDTEKRLHAVNCFIDEEGVLWLVEPQNDSIYRPTSNSTFFMCLM